MRLAGFTPVNPPAAAPILASALAPLDEEQ
jgi:hypothetical protein